MDSSEQQVFPAVEPPRNQGGRRYRGEHRGPHRTRRLVIGAGLVAVVVAVGTGVGLHVAAASSSKASALASPAWSNAGWTGASQGGSDGGLTGGSGAFGGFAWGGGTSGGGTSGGGTYRGGGPWGGGSSGGTSSGGTSGGTTEATDAQQSGVVDIDVVLNGSQEAAGTGMVLTSTGEVLTNRHVVEGETSITVTVPATGRSYAARVVGMSRTTDVAVVQLENASGLATVSTSSQAVTVGEAVVGVGNAGGTGGTPSAAAGSVTGTNRSITASDTDGSSAEQLTGLIETDAAIRAGDSGGPLLDASNAVVGMDTAASAQGDDGYAIPITTALTAARAIEAGASGTQAGSGASTQGQASARHAFLGVEVSNGQAGALVGGVVSGSPAAGAGLVAGDTITSVAGRQIGGIESLASVMASLSPGSRVRVVWVDQDGASHSEQITVAASSS